MSKLSLNAKKAHLKELAKDIAMEEAAAAEDKANKAKAAKAAIKAATKAVAAAEAAEAAAKPKKLLKKY